MVNSKRYLTKESLWTTGTGALIFHGLIIAGFAFSGGFSSGFLPKAQPTNCIEVVLLPSSMNQPDATESSHLKSSPPTLLKEKSPPSKYEERNKEQKKLTSSSAISDTYGTEILFNPPPIYPLEARRKNLQGIVLIQLYLTEEGEVDHAIPLAPHAHVILETAALKAIYSWRFKPGAKTVEVPVEFKLVV